MDKVRAVIESALGSGRTVLSEYESKRILAGCGLAVTRELLAGSLGEVLAAADKVGFPLVLKASSPHLTHKTERGLVALDLRNRDELAEAYDRLADRTRDLEADFLVQEMVSGTRELCLGLMRDPVFGPCVMFGLGGIYTEILNDAVFRPAPLTGSAALAMMDEIRGRRILDAVRGLAAVDRRALAEGLMGLGRLGETCAEIREVDVNPVIIRNGRPVVVDALVVLDPAGGRDREAR